MLSCLSWRLAQCGEYRAQLPLFCGECWTGFPRRPATITAILRRMSPYIHELPEWPRFQWDHEALATPLAGARHRQGRLLGQMEALGFKVREQAVLRALTDDVLKTSDIEGETLDADQFALHLPGAWELTLAG